MMDWDRNKVSVEYDHFHVSSEAEGYRLWVSGFSNTMGDPGDSLTSHKGAKWVNTSALVQYKDTILPV